MDDCHTHCHYLTEGPAATVAPAARRPPRTKRPPPCAQAAAYAEQCRAYYAHAQVYAGCAPGYDPYSAHAYYGEQAVAAYAAHAANPAAQACAAAAQACAAYAPGAGASSSFKPVERVRDWPVTGPMATKIRNLLTVVGHIRHDVIVEKRVVGRLIGTGGMVFKELSHQTGAAICILDKEGPPPDFSDHLRLVSIVGPSASVEVATREIEKLAEIPAEMRTAPTPANVPPPWESLSRDDRFSPETAAGMAWGGGASAVLGSKVRASAQGQILVCGWPTSGPVAVRIRQLEKTEHVVRNDVIVEKRHVGKLIGHGGQTYKELQMRSGADICVLDKEGPPPGHDENMRMVVILGMEEQVAHATMEVKRIIETAGSGGGQRNGPGPKRVPYMGVQSYGTHDYCGVGAGPPPFCDVTMYGTSESTGEYQRGGGIGPAAGPPRKRPHE